MRTPFLLLASCGAVCAATISLSGKVVDESGAPVAQAAVSLEGVTGSVRTDAQGAFLLSGDANGVSVKDVARIRGIRLSAISNTVEWASAGTGATLDAFGLDGRAIARDIPFVDGRATLPGHAGIALALRIKRDGIRLADLTGAGTSALRQAAAKGVLKFERNGFAPDTLSVDTLEKTGIEMTLVASDPWIPTTLEKSGTMVRIVAANKTFAMGSNQVWDENDVIESPRHSVKFTKDFWMDTVETTQALYDSVMKNAFPGYEGSLVQDSVYGDGPTYPAYDVTAGGAILYCNARSKMEGKDTAYTYTAKDGENRHASLQGAVVDMTKNGYRLPTEAEWEYAARAGTTTDFPWGEMALPTTAELATALNAHAVWQGNSYGLGTESPAYGTHPVASMAPSAYGLYDMQGNLSEWCWDALTNEGYAPGQAIDPFVVPDPSIETGATDKNLVRRGGHWANDPDYLRSSNRTFEPRVYFSYNEGFRTVRTAN